MVLQSPGFEGLRALCDSAKSVGLRAPIQGLGLRAKGVEVVGGLGFRAWGLGV